MGKMLGKNRNSNDTAVLGAGIPMNAATSTTIVTLVRTDSMMIMTNDGNQDLFVKLQAASVDNDKKGFILFKGTTSTLDLEAVTFVGEVSGITKNGLTTIYTTVF